MTAVEEYALAYARRGWPVFILEPGGKAPLTNRKACPNGVKNATTDPGQIKSWLWRFPDANLGIACGRPGPTVQDVDDLGAAIGVATRIGPDVPTVQTPGEKHPPGLHWYFAGIVGGNEDRGWGELRSTGYYVVAPPSVIPSGAYRWMVKPNGVLPELPPFLAPTAGSGAGCGEHQAPAKRVPHGQRHPYLRDFAVRLVRGGITDRACIEAHLWCEFERVCEPLPRPQTIPGIAKWAAESDIANHQNTIAEIVARWKSAA
jgi:hypothetical protein